MTDDFKLYLEEKFKGLDRKIDGYMDASNDKYEMLRCDVDKVIKNDAAQDKTIWTAIGGLGVIIFLWEYIKTRIGF